MLRPGLSSATVHRVSPGCHCHPPYPTTFLGRHCPLLHAVSHAAAVTTHHLARMGVQSQHPLCWEAPWWPWPSVLGAVPTFFTVGPPSAALAGLRPGSSQPAHIAEVHRPAVPRARLASGLQVQRLLVLGCMTARAPGTRCDRTEITKAGLRRGRGGAAHGRWSLGRPWGRAEGR